MKIINTRDNKYRNTYDSEEIQFAISADEQRHVMGMLRSQIYSDKILAPIRELSCNAFDANIEVGNFLTPIEIRLPDSVNPIWSVRDFGPGLTHEEIKNIFTKYGASTKRDSNEATGCLGIGSKSPFAYTDQFTVETWQKGEKRTYVAAINSEDYSVIHLASTMASAKQDGTRVSLPIKDQDIFEFKKKTTNYLHSIQLAGSYYKVLNDSWEEPEINKIHEGSDENWYIAGSKKYHTSLHQGHAKIIMGHVAYPLVTSHLKNIKAAVKALGDIPSLYIRMPLGSLSIAASRESLEYNDQTITYLSTTLPSILEDIQRTLCADIINADNLFEATKLWNTAREELPYHLKTVLDKLEHKKTGETVKASLAFHILKEDGSRREMDCMEYKRRTLRTGKQQIQKLERQFLRPEVGTVLFYNDKEEAKTKIGRRVKAYITSNPDAQVIIANHSMKDIKSSTMASYANSIKKISNIEPLPINYSNNRKGKGVNGPSKVNGELYLFDTKRAAESKNINRDCFTIIDDVSTIKDTKLSVKINGFRYADKDNQFKPGDVYESSLANDCAKLLRNRYGHDVTIVGYRPKHAADFTHIPGLFSYTMERIKKELKDNPDMAWEVLLFRTAFEHDVGEAHDEWADHDLYKLLPYLYHSKNPSLRYLHTLYEHREQLKSAGKASICHLDALLHTFDISPQKFTRKKVPDITKLATKALDQQPILLWISLPYQYRWGRTTTTEQVLDKFKTDIQKVIR